MRSIGDVKNSPRTGAWFTEGELVGWCVLMFVLGAAFAVVVLFALSTGGM